MRMRHVMPRKPYAMIHAVYVGGRRRAEPAAPKTAVWREIVASRVVLSAPQDAERAVTSPLAGLEMVLPSVRMVGVAFIFLDRAECIIY